MSRLLSALVTVALVGGWAMAEDKKPADKPVARKDDKKTDAPSGVWTRKTDEGLTLQLDFSKKEELVVTVAVEDNKLTITTKLSEGKDGKWTAKATKVVKNGDFPVEISDKYEFSFKLKVEKDKATLSDFDANEHAEQGKHAVEGEYKKKEDK
ncbi:MAG: hypothetical protein MUF18_11940 [Fimbriiglobus sp.]|jgi:hypothetical protein|nr:hypothetical protein [Fimbriiglobus sp.]